MLLPVLWLPAMVVSRTYEKRFLWVRVEEYRRVVAAAVGLLAAVGFVSSAIDLRLARGFVVLALPGATLLTLRHASIIGTGSTASAGTAIPADDAPGRPSARGGRARRAAAVGH
ncbi:hypothetical protein [Modestobacter altitudinis]|uniref:hypothetical protein n=1 Tax=Modestobacter altitudinis TaxID=2213158 RepID=UPI001486DE96|nr:hypothetical protein [Modestobacter altitudinis]